MKKVLVVEDDEFILDLYKRQLENAGFSVTTAMDGEQVAEKVNDRPDLVLLDVMLPKKNGLDVLRDLKANELTRSIPVILLTNLGQDSIVKQGFELGASGYLIKSSVTPNEVIHQVTDFLDKNN